MNWVRILAEEAGSEVGELFQAIKNVLPAIQPASPKEGESAKPGKNVAAVEAVVDEKTASIAQLMTEAQLHAREIGKKQKEIEDLVRRGKEPFAIALLSQILSKSTEAQKNKIEAANTVLIDVISVITGKKTGQVAISHKEKKNVDWGAYDDITEKITTALDEAIKRGTVTRDDMQAIRQLVEAREQTIEKLVETSYSIKTEKEALPTKSKKMVEEALENVLPAELKKKGAAAVAEAEVETIPQAIGDAIEVLKVALQQLVVIDNMLDSALDQTVKDAESWEDSLSKLTEIA